MRRTLLAAAALIACALPAGAQQAPARAPVQPAGSAQAIQFRSDPNAREVAIVREIYADFVRQNQDLRLETSVVDLNGDGVAEVAVRFVHRTTCEQQRCHTVLLSYSGGWSIVLERRAEGLALSRDGLRSGEMATLVLDGGERWNWSGERYRPDLPPSARVLEAAAPAPAAIGQAAAAALRADIGPPEQRRRFGLPDISWRSVEIDVATGARVFMVVADMFDVCGAAIGCPTAIVQQGQGQNRVIGVTYSFGRVSVLPSEGANRFKDIRLGDIEGVRTMRFDGREYQLAATSYPSRVTPAP